jgi:hypothetical protein
MSKMRPELSDGKFSDPTPSGGTAYLMILNAIESRKGLIAGSLQAYGEYCSIGAYFHVNPRTALPSHIIDEVAMVNDSIVGVTARQRKVRMKRWLRWKLMSLGMPMPGRRAKKAAAPAAAPEPTTKA